MYEPNSSWSLPEHLFQVSEWSAFCTNPLNPFSCTNALQNPNPSDGQPHYAWTDMTYLLHRYGVSWGYYVFQGTEPDCEDDSAMTCAPVQQGPKTPGIWNPLPSFTDVAQDGQLGNIQTLVELLHGGEERQRCRPSPGSTPTARSPSIRRRWSAPARRT